MYSPFLFLFQPPLLYTPLAFALTVLLIASVALCHVLSLQCLGCRWYSIPPAMCVQRGESRLAFSRTHSGYFCRRLFSLATNFLTRRHVKHKGAAFFSHTHREGTSSEELRIL